ncbi:hypothetical protein BDN67DRAFT_961855, partial [Paxillus ammoniavirescens]
MARRPCPNSSKTPDPTSSSESPSRPALREKKRTGAATEAHKRQKMDQDNCSRVENKSSSSPSWKAALYENSRSTTREGSDELERETMSLRGLGEKAKVLLNMVMKRKEM